MKPNYDHAAIEKKWRKIWQESKLYEVDSSSAENPFYCLDMFPYPSGDGLHVGHWRGYVLSDFYARYHRLKGKSVLHPMGFDAFGLPAEQAAIKHKSHPKKFTDQAIKTFSRQLDEIGAAFDWSKTLSTSDPNYYHWTQWLFLQFFRHGLAEKRQSLVNWCPKDQTVLANEQVVDGCCERCGTRVTKKELEQWFLKTTEFAEELVAGLEKVQWPEHVKSLQKNWIGKNQGAEIIFPISNESSSEKPNFILLHGYTGRADKNFIPWLKQELEDRGYKVQAPQLPNTDSPKESEQVDYVIKNCQIDENTILVGHSLGGVVANKVLQKINRPIAGLVLVAPAVEPEFRTGELRPFWKTFTWDYNYTQLKKLTNFQLILSDSQEEQRQPYLRVLSQKLGAPLLETKAAREHFCANKELFILESLFPQIKVFTTRPDTIFGVTALVLAPEHPMVQMLVTADKKAGFKKYLQEVEAKTNVDRAQGKESAKTAFFTGNYAVHPLTDEKIPVWLADYVLMEYGTGAVMSVPAHDERDFMFAKAHDLPIKEVIAERFVQTTEPGIYRPDEPTKTQDGIIVFVKHWKDDKYIALKWEEVAWGTLLTGSVDDGMTPEETVLKEIREETGYLNAKITAKLGVADGLFYHVPKKTNKLVHGHIFVAELSNDKRQAVDEEENSKHDVEWLTIDELGSFLTPETHQYALKLLRDGFRPHKGRGSLINSAEFTGLQGEEAAEKIIESLKKKKLAQKTTTYRLRDWLVSRQRYWGAPIPIVYDPEGKPHAVKDEHLPLLLPTDVDFLPVGESPLARSQEYLTRAEEQYGKGWHFEADTLDTFVDSSWYFLRYLSPHDPNAAFRPELVNKWLPIDLYVGGIEHATLHLLYARFVTKFLAKYGYIDRAKDEPIKTLYNIGMITLHGAKMSKSKGNVVSPDELVEHYGTDALRGYELFIGPMDVEAEWNSRGINGVHRFLIKVFGLQEKLTAENKNDEHFAHYLQKIEPMIRDFRLNTAVSEAMKLVNKWETQEKISQKAYSDFLVTLSPIFPFLCEELWQKLGGKNSIFQASWPTISEKIGVKQIQVLVGQKFIQQLNVADDATEETLISAAKAEPKVQERLKGKKIIKVIYKPAQMINFITGQ